MGANILGRKLAAAGRARQPIGVMLPNAVAAPVTVFALMSAGRVPAMINFSAGLGAVVAACRAAEVDDDPDLARLHREGQARQAGRPA